MGKPLRVLEIMGIVQNGGVEAVIMNYYRNIDKSKVQFDFVMHEGSNSSYIEEVINMGARVYEITPYTNNILKFTCAIYKVIRDGKYEIVHSNMNSMSMFPLFAAWIAGARIRILHNHTTDNKAEGLRSVIKRLLRPFARMFANQYWACSKLAGIWMYGRKLVDNREVTIINNAIDLKRYTFDEECRKSLRQRLGLEEKFVVGHVGRFMKQKNHDLLIDIFEEFVKEQTNAMLLLIGDGPLLEHIQQKVNRLGLQNKVVFLGPRNDVFELYNAMDVFVLPSFYEGLPIVGVEVQANGLPLICSSEVTSDVAVNSNVSFISLDTGLNHWVNSIKLSKRIANKDLELNFSKSCFNIIEESKKLCNLYLKLGCNK